MLFYHYTYKDLKPDLLPTYLPTYLCCILIIRTKTSTQTYYLLTSIPMLFYYHTYKDLKPDLLPTYLCCILIIPTKTSNQTTYLPTYAVFLSYNKDLNIQAPMVRTETTKFAKRKRKFCLALTFSRQQLSEQI